MMSGDPFVPSSSASSPPRVTANGQQHSAAFGGSGTSLRRDGLDLGATFHHAAVASISRGSSSMPPIPVGFPFVRSSLPPPSSDTSALPMGWKGILPTVSACVSARTVAGAPPTTTMPSLLRQRVLTDDGDNGPCVPPRSVIIVLRRPPGARWGLSVSLHDEAFLMISDVDAGGTSAVAPLNGLVGGSATTSAPLLRPGDAVLSLNGVPTSSFPNLDSVTSYMLRMTVLTAAVLRDDAAFQAATLALRRVDLTYEARLRVSSMSSYKALRDALTAATLKKERTAVAQATPLMPSRPPGGWPHRIEPLSAIGAGRGAAAANHERRAEQSISARTTAAPHGRRNLLPRLDEAAEHGTSASMSSPAWFGMFGGAGQAGTMRIGNFDPVSFHVRYATSDLRTDCFNSWFRDDEGNPIRFDDNIDFDPDDGTRAYQFLNPEIERSFPQWLAKRKKAWQKKWNFRPASTSFGSDAEDESSVVAREFWLSQGHPTFQHWLAASKAKWKRSYSWHRAKRRRLERESEEEVYFPSAASQAQLLRGGVSGADAQFTAWLRVRKNQWRIMRRKRQRRLEEEAAALAIAEMHGHVTDGMTRASGCISSNNAADESSTEGRAALSDEISLHAPPFRTSFPGRRSTSTEIAYIDELLEDEERRAQELEDRPPLDISFVFDSSLGAPDDVIAHCMSFLHVSEHGKLLCINSITSAAIKQREDMWRSLCPKHWTLPRRPRKPWHVMYITKNRDEEEASRKRSDDLLTKVSVIMTKGDHLNKVEKLVLQAEKNFAFSVDYTSGVVMERNSILNLAVINGRQKVARWLIENKSANIESCDRGNFTPLLNAAWAGDKHMVRLLLSNGADRRKVGTGHYTQPLAPPDFEGLTAEGWAREKGHNEVADLIRLGLA